MARAISRYLWVGAVLWAAACGDEAPPGGTDMAVVPDLFVSCSDNALNGTETDVDCGGGNCTKCGSGKKCNGNADCMSGVCRSGACVAAACADQVRNGTETDVDCGGGACPKCAPGKACAAAGDCSSGVCMNDACVLESCSDKVKNGNETDVDCGGTCPKCDVGKGCNAAIDCNSGACTAGVCAASCTDKIKNGSETDVDCGGGCPPCTVGKACGGNADCADVCTSGSCRLAASCKELHDAHPSLGGGVYTVDPDGGGAAPPAQVTCDMPGGYTFRTGGMVQNSYTSIVAGCTGGFAAFQVRSPGHAAALKKYVLSLGAGASDWYYVNFFSGPDASCSSPDIETGYLSNATTWVDANITESTLAPLSVSSNCNEVIFDPIPLNGQQGFANRSCGATCLYNLTEVTEAGVAVCSINDVP